MYGQKTKMVGGTLLSKNKSKIIVGVWILVLQDMGLHRYVKFFSVFSLATTPSPHFHQYKSYQKQK